MKWSFGHTRSTKTRRCATSDRIGRTHLRVMKNVATTMAETYFSPPSMPRGLQLGYLFEAQPCGFGYGLRRKPIVTE